MSIAIRLADLDSDRRVLIDLMLRYLTPRSDERKFDWLYRKNPDGPARVWVAIDTEREEIIGSGAAIPRRMYVDGREQMGCLLADFWIHPQYRSLGPAIQLQRACIEDFRAGRFALCYDFPQSNMEAVYKRLGISLSETLLRLSKPLHLDKQIERVVPVPLLRNALSALSNRMLAYSDRRRIRRCECTVALHEGSFGKEFSSLEQRVNARYGICVKRSAEFLNWRYRHHYFLRYEILAARCDSVLTAYVVYVDTGESGQIVDVFGVEDFSVLRQLILAAVTRFRERGKVAVSVQLLASHYWVALFESLGFYVRESFPLLAVGAVTDCRSNQSPKPARWFLTYGDIDT